MADAYATAEIIACVGPWLIAAAVGGAVSLMFAGVFWAGMKWRDRHITPADELRPHIDRARQYRPKGADKPRGS